MCRRAYVGHGQRRRRGHGRGGGVREGINQKGGVCMSKNTRNLLVKEKTGVQGKGRGRGRGRGGGGGEGTRQRIAEKTPAHKLVLQNVSCCAQYSHISSYHNVPNTIYFFPLDTCLLSKIQHLSLGVDRHTHTPCTYRAGYLSTDTSGLRTNKMYTGRPCTHVAALQLYNSSAFQMNSSQGSSSFLYTILPKLFCPSRNAARL